MTTTTHPALLRTTNKVNAWAGDRRKWPKGFTAGRDGWFRWYEGQTYYVCAKTVPAKDVEMKWAAKRDEIDSSADKRKPARRKGAAVAYKEALSLFLDAMELRMRTGLPTPLSARTVHNYTVSLNAFGRFIKGSAPMSEIGPDDFGAYGKTISHLSPSAYESEIARISAFFNWCVGEEIIEKFRPGQNFARPGKQRKRDARIDRKRRFDLPEIAKMWKIAPLPVRCWMALGICCAFNNSDIGNLPSECVDLDAGLIDFRRRKTGKVQRLCPLPRDVVKLLRQYEAPPAASPEFEHLFFRTRTGRPFVASDPKPLDMVSRRFWQLVRDAGVTAEGERDGRNFAGLRTTFRNLCPHGRQWADEIDVIMGHLGGIDAEHYREEFGLKRLKRVVDHVWSQVSKQLGDSIFAEPEPFVSGNARPSDESASRR